MQTQVRGLQIRALSPAARGLQISALSRVAFSTLRLSHLKRDVLVFTFFMFPPIFLSESRSYGPVLTHLEPIAPVSVFLVLDFGGHTTMPSLSYPWKFYLVLRNFLSWFSHADSPRSIQISSHSREAALSLPPSPTLPC